MLLYLRTCVNYYQHTGVCVRACVCMRACTCVHSNLFLGVTSGPLGNALFLPFSECNFEPTLTWVCKFTDYIPWSTKCSCTFGASPIISKPNLFVDEWFMVIFNHHLFGAYLMAKIDVRHLLVVQIGEVAKHTTCRVRALKLVIYVCGHVFVYTYTHI